MFFVQKNNLKNRKNNYKKQTGITLIALTITIIVLLILASITIATTAGNSGIFNKTVQAKRTAEEISNMTEMNALVQEEKVKNGGKIDYAKFLSNTNKIVRFLNDLGYEYDYNGVFLSGTEALRIDENGNIDGYRNNSINSENKSSITATTAADKMYATNYRIYGNSIQDTTEGDPSPDNPIEIESVGDLVVEGDSDFLEHGGKYRIPVTVSGKNLFNINEYLDPSKYTNPSTTMPKVSVSGNKITIANLAALSIKSDILKKLKPSTGYSISFKKRTLESGETSNVTYRVAIIPPSGNPSYVTYGGNYANRVLPDDLSPYKFLTIYATNNGVISLEGIQIEEGSTITEYEPYFEPVTYNIYLDEPLRKVGDYADYIDLGQQKVVRKIETKDLGSLNWTQNYDNKRFYTADLSSEIFKPQDSWSSDIMLTNYRGIIWDSTKDKFASLYKSRNVFIKDSSYANNTSDTFKNDLTGQYIYYPIKTEIQDDIELPNILLNAGTNIITVGTKIAPSKIELDYLSAKE